ncbi:MAG: HNH endonuclease signature motif containing protein [Acetobacter okinawensis]|uniref:HNH endonuclease signature motif containing protein n=1 Tax=Acetobacter okinawensis TaxID=1076594 RepID=UPI0039ED9586
MTRKSTSAIERLRGKLKVTPQEPGNTIPSPCHVFTGAKFRNGYGAIQDGKKKVKAHRVAWEAEHGPIPSGQVIRHKCGNRACCNVTHMELGTRAENSYDCIAEGHGNWGKPHHALFKVVDGLNTGMTQQEIATSLNLPCGEVGRLTDFWAECGDEYSHRTTILAPCGELGETEALRWLDERLAEDRQSINGAVVLLNETPALHSEAIS